MAALSAKKRVFDSVFSPQAFAKPSPDRGQLTDSTRLNLPAIHSEADVLNFTPFNPTGRLVFQPPRDYQNAILWYTNHVRRHYLHQMLPIIRKVPGDELSRLIQILEGAHRLYFDRLGSIFKGVPEETCNAAVKNFRLDLSTVVSNSIPDRSSIKAVMRKHVFAILNRAASENELLAMIRSLCSVGLGGEKLQIVFAEVMDDSMREHVLEYQGIWKESNTQLDSDFLPRSVQNSTPSRCTKELCEWIENRYAKLAVQVFEILEGSLTVSWTQVEKWKEMSIGHLAKLRTQELFDIVAQWPNANEGLNDLRTGITTPQRRLRLTDVFSTKLNDQLLHPGASTLQILQNYISMIRSFHILDHSNVLLSRVAFPLQLYLCSREDTVRIVIAGLLASITDEQGNPVNPGGDKLVELAMLLNQDSDVGRAEDEELDWHDLEWVPDPVDAGPGYKRSKNADIIGTLIRVLGSQDVFIKEFQNIIGEHLLKQDGGFEKEIKVLELLKTRFGEAPLQSCEVMLKDIQDSARVNTVIRRSQHLDIYDQAATDNPESQPSLHARILSRLFWPQLHEESYRIPDEVASLLKSYEQGFETLKSARKLTWLHALGQATVELELEDRTVTEEVHTWQATVVWAFESIGSGTPTQSVERSVDELVELLEMDEALVRSALKFWANKLVLHETDQDTFTVLETLNQEERSRSKAQTAASPSKSTDEDKALTISEGITTEKMQMYWQFIQGMLTNSSSQMLLQQIAVMLKMLIVDGFPYSNEELQEFLGAKVQSGELEVNGGKYKLKR